MLIKNSTRKNKSNTAGKHRVGNSYLLYTSVIQKEAFESELRFDIVILALFVSKIYIGTNTGIQYSKLQGLIISIVVVLVVWFLNFMAYRFIVSSMHSTHKVYGLDSGYVTATRLMYLAIFYVLIYYNIKSEHLITVLITAAELKVAYDLVRSIINVHGKGYTINDERNSLVFIDLTHGAEWVNLEYQQFVIDADGGIVIHNKNNRRTTGEQSNYIYLAPETVCNLYIDDRLVDIQEIIKNNKHIHEIT